MSRKKQELSSVAPVPNLQRNIHIRPLAFDVVGIEHFGIPTFQDAALATRLAVVQAFPGFQDIGQSLFSGGVVYLRGLHGFFKLRICLNFTVNMFFVDFSVYLRLFLAPLPSRFLQIDHYLLHPERENLLKNSSQLNSK